MQTNYAENTTGEMTTGENKQLVLRHLDLAWNKGDYEQVKDYLCSGFFYKTTFTEEILSLDQYIQFISELRSAIPDLEVREELVIGEGQYVVTQVSFFGAVARPIFGIPPSDKVIAFSAMSIWTIANRRIASLETLMDVAGIERQVGVSLSTERPLQMRR